MRSTAACEMMRGAGRPGTAAVVIDGVGCGDAPVEHFLLLGLFFAVSSRA